MKDLTVLVLSSDEKIENKLNEIITSNEEVNITTVKSLVFLGESKAINPDIIILDEGSFDLQRERVNFIKGSNNLASAELIGVLSEHNKGQIHNFSEIGIQELVFSPYTVEEMYMRIKSVVKTISIKNQCRLKTIQLKSLINNIPFMAWLKDEENKYLYVNKKFEEISGRNESEIKGNDDEYVWGNEKIQYYKENDSRVIEDKKQITVDVLVPYNNEEKHFSIYKAPIVDEYEHVRGTMGIASDITEVKHMEAELDIILENIPLGVCVKDTNGKIINVNEKFLQYYDITKEAIIGSDGSKALNKENYALFKEEDSEVIYDKCGKIFERKIKINDEFKIMEVHKEPIIDDFEKVIGIVVLIRDITRLRNHHEKIERLAYTDQLTGLDNRRSLYEHINNGEADSQKCLTILLVDLDNFKKLNDSLGHWYGDEALIKVSQSIKEVCGEAFVARTGGDEFVIIFEDVLSDEILMKKIGDVLRATNIEFVYEERVNIISASIGVVKSCAKNQDVENILTKGFLALYKAKEQGKNQYIMYTEELEAEKRFNDEIEAALRGCINNDEVKVYFQPQYGKNRINGKDVLVGFEALFRWDNLKYKHMPVIDIIRTIERLNLINLIEEYVMIESFKFAKKINEGRKEKVVVSINVSALQIMEEDFVEKVKALIDEVGVSPEVIGVEITETVLLENIDENIFKINALRNLGMKVALDDFGTGYSSLNYLVKLPLSHVKIDKSFISNMSNGFEYIKLIGLITEVTHSLGLKVVAEGVEKYDELVILDGMGIDFIQGYLFSKPLPREEAEALAFKSE